MIRHIPIVLRNRLTHTRRIVDGHSLEIPPGVMDPVLFKTGLWFAQAMRQYWSQDEHLLDLGCGAGLLGVFAQQDGLHVTATDLDPTACKAARLNGLTDVRQGQLFEPVLNLKFDHICFNPPYYQHVRWYTPFKRALVGSETLIQNLLESAIHHLTEGGTLWLATGRGAEWLWPILEQNMSLSHQDTVDGENMMLWILKHD